MYSCIVPVYNERPRINNVLTALIKIPSISQILCVDDGSTDGSGDYIAKKFPAVRLLRHEENLGKAKAITSAIARIKENAIILIDSDLVHVTVKDINRSIRLFENNQFDCLMLCARPVNILDKCARALLRLPHCATGNRILIRRDVNAVLRNFSVRGYNFEFMLNRYLMENKKSVAYTNISAQNVFKSQKVGLRSGVIGEIRMWMQIIRSVGIAELAKQALFFARHEV